MGWHVASKFSALLLASILLSQAYSIGGYQFQAFAEVDPAKLAGDWTGKLVFTETQPASITYDGKEHICKVEVNGSMHLRADKDKGITIGSFNI